MLVFRSGDTGAAGRHHAAWSGMIEKVFLFLLLQKKKVLFKVLFGQARHICSSVECEPAAPPALAVATMQSNSHSLNDGSAVTAKFAMLQYLHCPVTFKEAPDVLPEAGAFGWENRRIG